jgi:lipid-binding SYLF domain-containing protein
LDTAGSTFEFQVGGEGAAVVMLAMTQKAVDSLLSSSFNLGGDTSVAIGPAAIDSEGNLTVPDVTADFVSFAKSEGEYVNLYLSYSS